MLALMTLVLLTPGAYATLFDLESVKMALWYDGEGDDRIQIMDVPRIHHQSGGGYAFLIDDPFMISDRPTQDINIVSLYRITTGAELDGKDRPVKFFIDVSKAENTKRLRYTIKQVAEAAAICIRARYPMKDGIPLVVRDGKNETPIEPPRVPPTKISPAKAIDKLDDTKASGPTQPAEQVVPPKPRS